ncbi:MAG: ion transporter [Pseudomonadota bacterium]
MATGELSDTATSGTQAPGAQTSGAQTSDTTIRARVLSLISHHWFERFIVGIIVANAITLGLETSPTVMGSFGDVIGFVDQVFLTIFVVEIVLRMYAHGLSFWRDPWSWFDFIIVAISLIPASGNLSILRALRILRVLRLISAVPAIRRVVGSLLTAIPSMGAIMMLLCLINYVFAVMATKLFGSAFPEWFGTIGASLYTLFQIMTLESWSMGIVRPVMEVYPYAWLLFVPYIMVVTFAVLNLFIGIVVDAMQQQNDAQTDAVIEVTQKEYHHLVSEIGALRREIRALSPTQADGDRRAGSSGASTPPRP